eukprot:COSAG01_NODE_519_length_16012_cov_4.344058_16_plen_243_part_00
MKDSKINQPLGKEISEAFIQDHIVFVKGVVNQLFNKLKLPVGIEKDDLLSWGLEGLIHAKERYTETGGSNFKTYAYYRVKGKIYDNLRLEFRQRNPVEFAQHRERVQEKICEATEMYLESQNAKEAEGAKRQKFDQTLKEIVSQSAMSYLLKTTVDTEVANQEEGGGNPEKEFMEDDAMLLWKEVKKLDDLKSQVVTLMYVEELKQNEVAHKLQISKSKVSRLHADALIHLKRTIDKVKHLN